MTRRITQDAASALPGLYNAAAKFNYPPEVQELINQAGLAVNKGKELNKMPLEEAKKEFRTLDTDVQNNLKLFFSSKEWHKEDPSLLSKTAGYVLGGVTSGLKVVASPLVYLFKAADVYDRALSTKLNPLRFLGLPVAEGYTFKGNTLKKATLREGFSGKNIYNKDAITKLTEEYGPELILVARGIHAGLDYSEIIQDYGSVDDKILGAIGFSSNEPEKFNEIFSKVKLAQTSYGRDKINKIDTDAAIPEDAWYTSPTAKLVFGDLKDPKIVQEWKDLSSGFYDGLYSIMKDPLTYTSGGLIPAGKIVATKFPSVGLKLMSRRERLKYFGKNGDVESVFADPKVRELWDYEVGPKLKAIADEKSEPKKVNLIRQFGFEHWELRNAETIDLFIKKKMFSAKAAHTFFRQTQDLSKLMSGRVDGLMFASNGIPFAKRYRRITSGATIALDALFNPSSVSKFSDEALKALDERNAQAQFLLERIGTNVDESLVPGSEFNQKINDIQKDVEQFRKGLYQVGRRAARTPFMGEILHGKDSIKTIETFKNLARLVFDRDLADALALRYLKLGEDENRGDQIILARGLYIAVMLKAGLGGTVKGRNTIKDEISNLFNDSSAFSMADKTEVPAQALGVVSPRVLVQENNVPYVRTQGVFQPVALSEGIRALDYLKIIRESSPVRMKEGTGRWQKAIGLPGFIARSNQMEAYNSFWVRFTLFPRLGMRGAADELTTLGLGGEISDMLGILSRQGHRLGKIGATYTGSTSSIGPFFKGNWQKLFKTGAYALDDAKRLEIAERAANRKAKELGVKDFPIKNLTAKDIKEETLKEVEFLTGTKVSSQDFKYIEDALLFSPTYLDSMVSSIASRSTLNGNFREIDVLDTIFTPSAITQVMRDMNLKRGKNWKTLSQNEIENFAKDSGKDYRAVAHLNAATYLFSGGNKVELSNGTTYDPSVAFFVHNGLKDTPDWVNAKKMLFARIGVDTIRNPQGAPILVIKNPEILKSFLGQFTEASTRKRAGETDLQIAEDLIDSELTDMYTTFHGSGTKEGYNEKLFKEVLANARELELLAERSSQKVKGKWASAFRAISFERWVELTKDFRMQAAIRTNLVFPEEPGLPGWYAKSGQWMAESMDRIVNGIVRQPAVSSAYVAIRKGYSKSEEMVKQKHFQQLKADNPWNLDDATLEKQADELARAQFTAIAQEEAINKLMKFVDNPSIQTNFSLSVRFVSRFYRATEDFWRRYIRILRTQPLRALYRMRLAHVGLDARGELYKDEKGDDYLIIPTDTIINHALFPVISTLTGKKDFIVPQFNEFTMKLRAVNPSFAPDAGQATLSSPIAGLSVVGLRALIGMLPDSKNYPALKAIDELDKVLLGSIGDNITWQRAAIPALVNDPIELLGLFGKDDRYITSLSFQAVAYMQANGLGLPADATVEEKNQYQKNLMTAARSIFAMQRILGRTTFTTFGLRESMDVPEYLKTAGIITPKAEFFSILAGIIKEDPTIEDPFELALATYIGKNPGKIVYTVPRDTRETRVILQKTKQVKDWYMKNKVFVDKYSDAALVFAPQMGEFDSSIYTFLQSADMFSIPKVEEYLDSVRVAEDKYKYYAVNDLIKKQLETEARIPERQQIIKQGEELRRAIRKANPLLDAVLDKPMDAQYQSEKMVLKSLTDAVYEPSTPIPQKERAVMRLAVDSVNQYLSFVSDEKNKSLINFGELKQKKKEELEGIINDLSVASPSVKEANRAIFKSLINQYSPDTVSAVRSSK